MAHQEGQDQDDLPDKWLSGFEDQCLEDFDSQTNMDDTIQRETEYSLQKLFSQFQNSATAIAQLYKGIGKKTVVLDMGRPYKLDTLWRSVENHFAEWSFCWLTL